MISDMIRDLYYSGGVDIVVLASGSALAWWVMGAAKRKLNRQSSNAMGMAYLGLWYLASTMIVLPLVRLAPCRQFIGGDFHITRQTERQSTLMDQYSEWTEPTSVDGWHGGSRWVLPWGWDGWGFAEQYDPISVSFRTGDKQSEQMVIDVRWPTNGGLTV